MRKVAAVNDYCIWSSQHGDKRQKDELKGPVNKIILKEFCSENKNLHSRKSGKHWSVWGDIVFYIQDDVYGRVILNHASVSGTWAQLVRTTHVDYTLKLIEALLTEFSSNNRRKSEVQKIKQIQTYFICN